MSHVFKSPCNVRYFFPLINTVNGPDWDNLHVPRCILVHPRTCLSDRQPNIACLVLRFTSFDVTPPLAPRLDGSNGTIVLTTMHNKGTDHTTHPFIGILY